MQGSAQGEKRSMFLTLEEEGMSSSTCGCSGKGHGEVNRVKENHHETITGTLDSEGSPKEGCQTLALLTEHMEYLASGYEKSKWGHALQRSCFQTQSSP